MKYYPTSEKDRNMQCFTAENHMCLTIGLEKLIPPPPTDKMKEVSVSNKDNCLFLYSTKSTVRNAISLSHPDSITKQDITSNFVTYRKWRNIEGEEIEDTLDSKTTVDVTSLVHRLCGISVAGCLRFQKMNIHDNKCFYLHEPKYEPLGRVSRLKPIPMPSRANDAGPLYLQWSFGFNREKRDATWCKQNPNYFSEAIFQSIFHTLTGRVVYLELLSNHLRKHMLQKGLPVPNDPDQPVYPTTQTYMEAVYFINSTLKGKRVSLSPWIIDQFSCSIPSCLKTTSGFKSMLKLLANKTEKIAAELLDEDSQRKGSNKRELAFTKIYSLLENFTQE